MLRSVPKKFAINLDYCGHSQEKILGGILINLIKVYGNTI